MILYMSGILQSYLLELQHHIHLTVQYLLQLPQVMLRGQPMHLSLRLVYQQLIHQLLLLLILLQMPVQ